MRLRWSDFIDDTAPCDKYSETCIVVRVKPKYGGYCFDYPWLEVGIETVHFCDWRYNKAKRPEMKFLSHPLYLAGQFQASVK